MRKTFLMISRQNTMNKALASFQVKIQQDAIDELDQIFRFIRQDSPARAKEFVKALQKKVMSLKQFPRRGSRAKILENDEIEVRFLEYKGYLVFYTFSEKERTVIVLHFASPGQNWVDFFLR